MPTTNTATSPFDRPKKFVIDDTGNSGPAVFFTKKNVKVNGTRALSRSKVTAIAVRERGSEKFNKILRFLLSVPRSMGEAIDSWVAVPHSFSSAHLLFSKRNNDGKIALPAAESEELKDRVERALWETCTILSVGQRCAD